MGVALKLKESPEIAQEQSANKKFDEIFNKIYGKSSLQEMGEGENAYEIQKDGNVQGTLRAFNNPNIGLQKIIIQWNGKRNNNSQYSLSRQDGKYTLETSVGETGKGQTIDNISSEELLSNILPNFEKRLNEAEILRVQERKKALEDANQYAYLQDQQDADRLLLENGLA